SLHDALPIFGLEGVPVLGLELHEQRDRIMRGGEDQRIAGGERLERTEDRGVAHRVRDRLHVQLGDALVMLAAGAALLGRALLDRLLLGAVDLDVCHGVLLRWGGGPSAIYYSVVRGKYAEQAPCRLDRPTPLLLAGVRAAHRRVPARARVDRGPRPRDRAAREHGARSSRAAARRRVRGPRARTQLRPRPS